MARASRHFAPNRVWHITHRCHRKQWLLKFAKDRKRWIYWLFEARRRYGVVVLNYIVTKNHIHLLVLDRGEGEIQRSMQLVAGRTAQEYNNRKNRVGAFWQDRYHATAIETHSHLQHCLTYIDLNMVRAGTVADPALWPHSGYADIIDPRQRYAVVDCASLLRLCGMDSLAQLRQARESWAASIIEQDDLSRNPIWSESVGVGTHSYLQDLKDELKIKKPRRVIEEINGLCCLKDSDNPPAYVFSDKNAF